MINEKQLIENILKGENHAFTLLIKQYQKLVLSIVYRLVNTNDDVEDICQDTFIKVYKNIKNFKFNCKLSTWIATIAYNTSINYLRKKKNYIDDFNDIKEINIPSITITEDPESILGKAEIKKNIRLLIDKLPHNYKIVLTLFHLNEFSYKEIEDITKWPEGTIKSYLSRGRKILKEKIIFSELIP